MRDVQRVKSVVGEILPAPVRRLVRRSLSRMRASRAVVRATQLGEFRADATRYVRSADSGESSSQSRTPVHLEAQLTRDYHRVEKGLALASPKRPFGEDVLARLETLIPVAQRANPDAAFVRAAESARDALALWNSGGGPDATVAPVAGSGDRGIDVDQFFPTRHSVRDFSKEAVSADEIMRVVELAAFSPSVCNREPWKVRQFFGKDVARILIHQNGNRGFAQAIPALLLVSVELGYFAGPGERNQAWIEGGIFSASLVWALHGIGLDSCMLNLSLVTSQADDLRAAVGMPESEVPIMMIAVGRGRPGHRVARSPRRTVTQLIIGNPRGSTS